MYSYVKRMSQPDKIEIQSIIDAHNELAPESVEITGVLGVYSLVKIKDSYIVVVDYSDGGHDSGSLVRCDKCNAITDLWDGQIEFCPECWADWS